MMVLLAVSSFLAVVALSDSEAFTLSTSKLRIEQTRGNKIKLSQQAKPLEREVLHDILRSDEIRLVPLSEIRSFRAWDFSWPTLTTGRRFTARNTYKSDMPLFSALETHNKGITHSLLRHIGALDEKNSIVLHGGALVDLILKRDEWINDWDLRLVGPEFINNEEKCVKAAKQFVESIFDWIREDNEQTQIRNVKHKEDNQREEALFDINAVQVFRVKSTITVIVPAKHGIEPTILRRIEPTILQLTFAPYQSVSELLRQSNPHCTRIAIHGGKVILDEAARYCLESLCVVLDAKSLTRCQPDAGDDKDGTAVRASAFEAEMRRAINYFNSKGFDIILPDLNMTKVPTRNLEFKVDEVLDLPALTVVYDQIESNKIMVNQLRMPDKYESSSRRAAYGYDETIDLNSGICIHHNIRCLVANVYDQFQFMVEGELTSPIFDFCPTITPRMVDKVYETVKAGLTSGSIQLDQVIQYFSATPPNEVLEQAVVEPIRKHTKLSSGLLSKSLIRTDIETILEEIIATEKKDILRKLEMIRDKMVEDGLDKLVVEFPETVSTEDQVAKALYGDYRTDDT